MKPPRHAPDDSTREVGVSRRELLAGAGAAGVWLSCGSEGGGRDDPFQHGVASGDPRPDSIILWTRVTPASAGALLVEWEVAADPAFA